MVCINIIVTECFTHSSTFRKCLISIFHIMVSRSSVEAEFRTMTQGICELLSSAQQSSPLTLSLFLMQPTQNAFFRTVCRHLLQFSFSFVKGPTAVLPTKGPKVSQLCSAMTRGQRPLPSSTKTQAFLATTKSTLPSYS